ncbi:acyltransferase family protein [Pseudomonas tremae]|uniref:acyltransferase n=1 Tax=Pseudomonas tremae TaxID=200454 RepID=UPI00210EF295|nr:acyltransferase family protein [Pseudomonas tremae]MCQ2990018.1 acyltransferase family protein [Pseudomonas tremae]
MSTNTTMKTRDFSLDALKAMAICMVVMIHISAPGFVVFGEQWIAALVYDSVSRISVPLFFMVTGSVLLNREHTLASVFSKVKVVLIPLVAWSIIYLVYNEHVHGQVVEYWAIKIIQGPVLHMWFIYALIGAYLFLPLTSRFFCSATRSEKLWIMILAMVGSSIMPFFRDVTGQVLLGLDMAYVPIYSAYMLMGAFLYEEINKIDKTKSVALLGLIVWVLGTMVTIFGTYSKTISDNAYSVVYFNYYVPSVLFATLGAYVFFVAFFKKNTGFDNKGISYLGRQTFGIYMCHMIPLQIIGQALSRAEWLSAWIWYPSIVVLTMLVSLFIVAVIQKIPVVRHICP